MAIKVEVFVSDSCPHCPGAVVVANEAKEVLGDQMDVEILNIGVDENRQRALDYQIMAVPTIAVNNEVAFVGAPTKEQLIEKIESLL